ncbi:MAG: trigger factor, partial [Saprospiraceae bacterium]
FNKTATNQGNLHITLLQEDLKPQIAKELEKIRKNAKIKGFRPGAVPTSMLQKLYGEGIKAEVMNNLINQAIADYQKDNELSFLGDLLPISEPMSESNLNQDQFEFIYEVGITPHLDIQSFINHCKLIKYKLNFSSSIIDAELDAFLKHYNDLKDVEEEIISNDLVVLKIKELENGQEKPEGIVSEFTILVDQNLTEELYNKVVQKKIGDLFEFNIQQVEKNQDEKSIRKYFLKLEDSDERIFGNEFIGEIVKVSRKYKPELNDELYQRAFGPDTQVKSEEDLRNKLTEDLDQFYNEETERFVELELSKKIAHYPDLLYPDAFLKNWLGSSFEEWKNKSQHDFDHDLIHFKEGLNWQIFKKAILQKEPLSVDVGDMRNLIISKYRAQIPGLNFSEDQWNQVAMNVMKDKEKSQEFYQEAQNLKMLSWLKGQITQDEQEISLEDFKEKVKELNKHHHEHKEHDHIGHDHEEQSYKEHAHEESHSAH